MKRIITIIGLLTTTSALSYGQNVESREDFMNAIHTELFKNSGGPVNLYYACNLAWFPYDTTARASLNIALTNPVADEMIAKSHKDTLEQQWDCGKMPYVKCIHDDAAQATPGTNGEIKVYDVSRPIFSNDGQYAIISLYTYNGTLLTGRCAYIFNKQTNGAWAMKQQFSCIDLQKK